MLREAVLLPSFGVTMGFIASGVILCGVILAIAYLSAGWIAAQGKKQLFLVGFLWLAATLAFEFSFGLLRGLSLSEILSAYTFANGNLWPFVLILTFFAPILTSRPGRRATR